MRFIIRFGALAFLAFAGCGGNSTTAIAPGPSNDGGDGGNGGSVDGAAPVALGVCPATGRGAIQPVGPCSTLTPADVGADPSGDNAAVAQYALEPVGTPKQVLLVQINGSGGTPAGQIADPVKNLYNVAASSRYHVLGIAYRSREAVGQVCSGNDACFEATRKTLLLGTFNAGASPTLSGIRQDEGLVWRLEATLQALARARPGAGWDGFLVAGADAASRINWSRVFASGHSQGGGHAAFLGKLFPVRGVLQLSSTCDIVGRKPATWTSASGAWATPSSTFIGLAAPTIFDSNGVPIGGDTICPGHTIDWENMAMAAANMHDDAATCGATGDTHSASIRCVDNYPRWVALLP